GEWGRTPEAAAWPWGEGRPEGRPATQAAGSGGRVAQGASGSRRRAARAARSVCRPGPGPGGVSAGAALDLADQVQRRGEGLLAFLPLRRAHLARMGGDVLGGLDLAQQVLGVAADALGGDFDRLDDAVRIDHEGRTVSQALAFAHVLEVVGDHARRVTEHRVLDLADRLGGVVPGLVREVGVGRDAVDLHAQLLELVVVLHQVL